MNTLRGRGARSTVAKPSSTASASERRLRVTPRRQGGAQQRNGDTALNGSDALQIVPPPPRHRDRRPAAIAATVVFGGDLIALGAAMLIARPAEEVNVTYAVFAMVALLASGAYRLRISLSALDEAPRLATVLAVPLLLLAPFAHSTQSQLLWQAATSVVAVVVMRAIGYALLRRARRRGLREATLVAGTGHVGVELANLIVMHPEYGLELTGFVGSPYPGLPRPLIGDVGDLDRLVQEHGIRRVLVAFGPTREAELVGVLRTAVLRDVEVHVVPRFFEVGVAPRGPDVDDLWGIPIYRMRQAALRARVWRFKRTVDLVLSMILLIVTAPVMALAALAVKLGSQGPVLFRQSRIGQYGEEIAVLKFRTLPADHIDDSWNASNDEYNAVGRWLRRMSIDELPQLWNVLRGDMSLVGPRPERGYLVEQFNASVSGYRDRHRLPVGLTGWAQVHGLRGDTSLRERVRFDNQYIEHWSLWRDVVILVRTLSASFRGPAAMSAPEPKAAAEEFPGANPHDTPASPAAEGGGN
jgi:exopolysaccharide biosynthesis polyprenyl glycosylphosphotransferase